MRKPNTFCTALRASAFVAPAVLAAGLARAAGSYQSFGPAGALHVEVFGNPARGYRAEIHDGSTLVATRGMTATYDLIAFPGTTPPVQSTGPSLIGSATGSLNWAGPYENGVGSVPGNVQAGATPNGISAITWQTPQAVANTWIQDILPQLTGGNEYIATISLEGTGTVYLDFYDGAHDNQSSTVTLNAQPQTVSVGVTVPAGFSGTPQIQIRTAGTGPVDLLGFNATVTPAAAVPPGKANELSNRYRTLTYDQATRTLTLGDAVNQVGEAVIARAESYRFVSPNVIDSEITTGSFGSPAVFWWPPYNHFNKDFSPLSIEGPGQSYESPSPTNSLLDSPIPAIGVTDGQVTYGIAAASTWDEPMPGYVAPHILLNGQQLAAPLIGTSATPITVPLGGSATYSTIFYRGDAGTYGLALGAELGMAEALGIGPAPSESQLPVWALPVPQGVLGNFASFAFPTIAQVTAYWLREASSSGSYALVPSQHYGPGTYMRDSFWTSYGLLNTTYFNNTETTIIKEFTAAISTSGSSAGHVPVTIGGPQFFDESGLYYLIRMFRDTKQFHLDVANQSVAQSVLDFIRANQVQGNAFVTGGPFNNGGFEITPDSWLDGYLFPVGAVNAYDQGLYVVALRAAQGMGLDVTDAQIAGAQSVYRGLYDPQLGYIRWLSTETYKSPDVLVGDALSLYLFNQPLLPDVSAINTLNAQVFTQYGMEDLAQADDSSVPPDQFLTLTNSPTTGEVLGIPEPGNWYQNGGSWLLWEFLAEYSALRHGDASALATMRNSLAAEVAVTPLSKEFKVTANNPAIAGVDPAWPFPLGSSGLDRQGYGWNTAVAAFLPAPLGGPAQ